MSDVFEPFNQSLYQSINPHSFSAPARAVVSEGNTGRGTLTVQVTLANGAIPVENATVQVFESGNGEPMETLTTDQSGKTPPLSLPAPPAFESQSPNISLRPFSVYDIVTQKEGFYNVRLLSIPVFDQITSIQPINLTPLREGGLSSQEIVIDEYRPQLL